MRTSLWPTGLVGRVGFVLFAAVALELVGSSFVFEQAELVSSDDAQARRIAGQVDGAARVLGVTGTEHRSDVAATLSEPSLSYEWSPTVDLLPPGLPDATTVKTFRDRMLAAEPTLAKRRLALGLDPDDKAHMLIGRVSLDDGSTVRFHALALGSALPNLYATLGSIALLSGCVLLAAILIVRTLAAPLRILVSATDAIGHGPPVHLEEHGPREIRRVASAFNAMQDRIAKLLKDRTEALAAVSHDLRTPIARMQLRAGFLSLPEDQAAFEADLSEMEAMLVDLNAYLSGETDAEKPKPTDLAALLQTLVDAATDAGHAATYDGPDRLTLDVRPLALKRAFSNIVNNAIAYGGGVRATLSQTEHDVVVAFDDDGPGIPEAELASVFEPFYRGDASRNRSTGGMGLGLAITRQAIWRHGGTIDLANRPEGGLRVAVSLPRRAS